MPLRPRAQPHASASGSHGATAPHSQQPDQIRASIAQVKLLVIQLLLEPHFKLSAVTSDSFKEILEDWHPETVQRLFPDGDWITADWVVSAYYEVRRLLPHEERVRAHRMSRQWIAQADSDAEREFAGLGGREA
ncbi:unnamed protein product [Discula destructiva]